MNQEFKVGDIVQLIYSEGYTGNKVKEGSCYTVTGLDGEYLNLALGESGMLSSRFKKVPAFTCDIKDAQPGDIVRCTEGTVADCYSENTLYKVSSVTGTSLQTVLDDKGRAANGWGFKHFEVVARPIKYSPNDGVIEVYSQEELTKLLALWGIPNYVEGSYPSILGNKAYRRGTYSTLSSLDVYTDSHSVFLATPHITFKEYIKLKEPVMETQEPIRLLTHKDVAVGDKVTICTEAQMIKFYGDNWRVDGPYGGWRPAMDILFGTSVTVTNCSNEHGFEVHEHSEFGFYYSACCTSAPSSYTTATIIDDPISSAPKAPTQYRKFLPTKKVPSPLQVWKGLCAMGKKEKWVEQLPTDLFMQCIKEGYKAMKSKVEFINIIGPTTKGTIVKDILDLAVTYKITNINEAFLLSKLNTYTQATNESAIILKILETSTNPAIRKELDQTYLLPPFARLHGNYSDEQFEEIYNHLAISRATITTKYSNSSALKDAIMAQVFTAMTENQYYSVTSTTIIEVKV